MNRTIKITILLSLIILALTACQPAAIQVPVPTPPPPVATPTAQAQAVSREAQVQSVEIQATKTEPVEVDAIVRGNLTEACAHLGDTKVSYASSTFMIELMAVSRPDQGCAQITTPFEQTIPLKTAGLPNGSYTVKANGVSAVFDLPMQNSPASEPLPTAGSNQMKTYQSDKYGYEVSYPADWKLQVNHPADAGQDPEYLTLTQNEASNLPQIDLWVRTGQAPMSGYENCEKNFVFRSLPACHLSLEGGQNPPAEIMIFQNGSANFYIRIIYQDKSSLKLFDDFMSSFRFTN